MGSEDRTSGRKPPKAEDAKLEALLYCASENEMSEWIDWFECEDKAASLINQLLVTDKDSQEKTTFEKMFGSSQCHSTENQ